MFILINIGILRSSYDSVDYRHDGRWVGEGYSETRACSPSPSFPFIHCGSLDLRSSLISDEMVLKFSSLVLAVSQLQPTGLSLTSWGAKGGKVPLSELWKEHGQRGTLLIYLLSPTERG